MSAELSARAQTLGRLLSEAGGAASVAELLARAPFGSTTATRALAELEAAGLLERRGGAKGTPTLTAAGLTRFAAVDPVSAGDVVDAAAAVWPYTHAAFLRLYLAAVIARRHLGPAGPHLGFVAVGEPRTGKSALFEQACHLLGLDAGRHTRELALMTPGEITGRRSGGVAVGFAPADYLADPVVLFDEFDKAPAALRDRAQKVLLQGKYRTVIEGQQLTVCCAPMLAGNVPADTGDRFAHVHRAYRTRRSVLLDTGAARAQLTDLGDRLEGYHTSCTPGALALDQLIPPASSLPSARPVWEQLRGFLAAGHDEDFPDERALDLLALGYAALRGVTGDDEAGLMLAAIYAAVDWHTCAGTVPGLLDPTKGTPMLVLEEAHRAYYRGRGHLASLEAAIAAQQAGLAQRAADARARARAQVRVSDDVVRGRGELAEQLRLARDAIDARKVPEPYKATAAGLREVLGKQRTSAQQLSKPDALEEARDRAARPLREAHALAERIAAERAAEARAHANATAAERQSRAEAKAAAKQQAELQRQIRTRTRNQLRTQLTATRQVLRELDKLYRRRSTPVGADPLRELERLNVVRYEPNPAATATERPRGLRRLLAAPEPMPGRWVALDGTSYPGGPGYCPALARWGEATRAVLAAALHTVYGQEDRLCAQLGVAARGNRIALPAPRPVASSRPATLLPAPGAKYGMHRG